MPVTEIADSEIELGAIVRERISGMVGIVTTHAVHISGCDRYGVRPFATERAERDEEFYYPTELNAFNGDVDDIDEDLDVDLDIADDVNPTTEVDFTLGNVLEDDVSGVEGYATTITFNLFNCPQVALTPTGDETDAEWADAPTVSFVRNGLAGEYADLVESDTESETGPVGADSRRREHAPSR